MMNHKQKLGYIILGAGIMAVGIIIGQIIPLDIDAQSNGVFDTIRCRRIEVIDDIGELGILLDVDQQGNTISVNDMETGEQAAYMGSIADGNGVSIYTRTGKHAVDLVATPHGGNWVIVNDLDGKIAVGLLHDKVKGNAVTIFDKSGKDALGLSASNTGNGIEIFNKGGTEAIRLISVARQNEVQLLDKSGKRSVVLHAERREKGIAVFNEAGNNITWIAP